MGSGILSGIVWGAVVGAVIVVVASGAAPRHDLALPQPSAAEVDLPPGTEFDRDRPDVDPSVPEIDARPIAGTAAPEPGVPGIADAPVADTEPAGLPDPDAVAGSAPSAPEVGGAPAAPAILAGAGAESPAPGRMAPEGAAGLAPGGADAPPTRPETTLAAADPAVPAGADDPAVTPAGEAGAAAPRVRAELSPSPSRDDPAEVPRAAAPEIATEASAPEAPTADIALGAPVAGADPAGRDDGREVAALAGSPEAAASPDLAGAGEAAARPAAGAAPRGGGGEGARGENTAKLPATDARREAGAAPRIGGAAGDGGSAVLPQVGSPAAAPEAGGAVADADAAPAATGEAPAVRSLLPGARDDRFAAAPGVRRPGATGGDRVRRLPTIGDGSGEGGGARIIAAPRAAPELPAGGDALLRHRAEVDLPADLPRLAIILVHTEPTPPGEDLLERLPKAVTIAVDAGRPAAADIAAAWRGAGHEIVLIPSLPAGARPQDVEVALADNFARVPEAVALMADRRGGFQTDAQATEQIVSVLTDTGHGLVTFPRGLNTARRIAERDGVTSALIFREIDDDSAAIDLGRASFRARQTSGVILVGDAEPDTLAAVMDWAAAAEVEGIGLAPLSAVLLPEAELGALAPQRSAALPTK